MLTRIWQLIIKEFIQFRRDRLMAIFLFTFPLLQLVLVAQTAGAEVADLPLAVLDQDNSRVSRALIQALDNTEELYLAYLPGSLDEVKWLLDHGQAQVAVVIPPNFNQELLAASGLPQVQVLVDGTNVTAGSAALHAAEGVIQSYLARQWSELVSAALPGGTGAAVAGPPVDLRTTIRFNPQLNGKYVAIPGLFAFVVYQVAVIVAAVALVRERELGTLEQLAVTPVRRIELLAGKIIPAVCVGLINFSVLFLVVVGVFHIPMRGSWLLLFQLSALFIMAEAGWGLMISSVARSQQQAVLIVFPLAMLDLSLSGYLVPVENMPLALRVLSAFSPLRHYMTILKAIMLRGADLTTLWPSVLALAALAVAVILLTWRNVARTLD